MSKKERLDKIKAKQEIIERLNDEIKRNEDDLARFNDIKRELNK